MNSYTAASPTAIVFYHANCTDGLFSALVAYESLRKNRYSVTIKELRYENMDVFEHIHDSNEVYFVDIAPSNEIVSELLTKGHRVIIIDHHEMQFDRLKQLEFEYRSLLSPEEEDNLLLYLYSAGCGATLCWEYFVGGSRPKILNYVEDYDLYKKN